MEYDQPVSVTGVKIYNRRDCCGDRTANLAVIVTDKYPEKGEKAEGINHILNNYENHLNISRSNFGNI